MTEQISPGAWRRPKPSRPVQYLLAAAFLAFLGLALYGAFFSPFVPTPRGVLIAGIVAGVTGAACAYQAVGGILSPANPAFNVSDVRLLQFMPLRVLIVGVVMALFAYAATASGAEGLVTYAVGRPGHQAMEIGGWRHGTSEICAGFELKGVFLLMGEKGTCAGEQYRDAATPGRKLILSGRVTALGIDVDGFQLGPRG